MLHPPPNSLPSRAGEHIWKSFAITSKEYCLKINLDGIVKSRHSRENGNPENSNYMKILDSCLRRNDRQWPFQTFYETILNQFNVVVLISF